MSPLPIRSSQSLLGKMCCWPASPSATVSLVHLVPSTLDTCRGRNTEGQCGVENKPVLSEPAVLRGLEAAGVQSIVAGKLHSAAVLKSGEVCTWGCGAAGKLGHGSSDNVHEPSR